LKSEQPRTNPGECRREGWWESWAQRSGGGKRKKKKRDKSRRVKRNRGELPMVRGKSKKSGAEEKKMGDAPTGKKNQMIRDGTPLSRQKNQHGRKKAKKEETLG